MHLLDDGSLLVSFLIGGFKLYNLDGKLQNEFSPKAYNPQESDIIAGYDLAPDGALYVGTRLNSLYALSPELDLRWSAEAPSPTGPRGCTPAVAPDGTVYALANGEELSAYSNEGTELWHRMIPGFIPFQGDMTAPDGTLYVSSRDLELIALTPAGDEKWRSAKNGVGISPNVYGPEDSVICPTDDGRILAYNSDGTLRWSTSWNYDGLFSRDKITATGNRVYYSEKAGVTGYRLVALDSSGGQLWQYHTTYEIHDLLPLEDGKLALVEALGVSDASQLNKPVGIAKKIISGGRRATLHILDGNGKSTCNKDLGAVFPAAPMLCTDSGLLLILDYRGVLHAYRL